MIDCLVIGYHETEVSGDELELALAETEYIPAPVRSLRRTNVGVHGTYRPYLDALSALRDPEPEGGIWTVAELPSLGTLYLVNYLRRRGHPAEFVNCFTYEKDRLAELLAQQPASVAITTTFYMMPGPVIEIIDFVRQHAPTVPIIVGGPLVDNQCRAGDTAKLQRFFDRTGADVYVWESQGEATLLAAVDALTAGTELSEVSNLFLRDDAGTWTLTRRRPEANVLDECSMEWSAFDPHRLGPTVSTRTARSCAFECAFCDYPERAGKLTLATIDTVERELEALAAMGVTRVAFIDDTFNVPMRRFKELCKMMVRRDFGIEWFSYFRCGHAKEPGVYDLMYDAGCRGVLLGIESADDRVLRNMDKRATVDDYRFGIEQLRKRDIFTHASFVVGFPGESEETVQNTINFLNDTGPDTFAVNHWYYLHATPIHVRAPQFGLTGSGYNWSHHTMNSDQALDAADHIFASVREAAWMPVNGLDFWGVPYLLGKGMTPGQITEFLRLAKALTPATRVAPGVTAASVAEAEQRFARFCAELPLAPSAYHRNES
ncbi:PhpK family radical SAM P-methyltransferase [Micromonospora sp. DT233]|uniref:PhpK family radical SAM P-methyltransferase n=1 Tax=Micromonospora sp. DT233 TaxID=3393432 RepID=UPI003CFA129E